MEYFKLDIDSLYVPIKTYEASGKKVTLIGATHFGDAEYYKGLQEIIDSIPDGLFEGLAKPKKEMVLPPEKERYRNLHDDITQGYRKNAKYHGLVFQKDALNYNKWERADMSIDELIEMAPAHVLEEMKKSAEQFNDEKLEKMYQRSPEWLVSDMREKMFMKYAMMRAFSGHQRSGKFEEIILDKRNDIALRMLDERLDSKPVADIGMIYGAAHLEGIERHLEKKGFKKTSEKWVRAWKIDRDI